MRLMGRFFKMLKAPWRKKELQRRRDRAQAEFEAAVARLSAGDVCFDCGANVGKFTEMFAATGCTVHAFEPDPYAFGVLEGKFADAPNVVLVNAALGIEDGEIALFRSAKFDESPERYSKSSSVVAEKTNVETVNRIAVPQVDFFRYLETAGDRVKIVKMDIEGAEVPILEKLFQREEPLGIEYLFVEMHEKQLPDMKKRFAAIRAAAEARTTLKSNLDWR